MVYSKKHQIWIPLMVAIGTIFALGSCHFTFNGSTNNARLVAGTYYLDSDLTYEKTGGLAFAKGQKLVVVKNGTGSGPGVVKFSGTKEGTFGGTITFVDVPLSSYSCDSVGYESVDSYDFTMVKEDLSLNITFNCSFGENDENHYHLYISNSDETIACNIMYR